MDCSLPGSSIHGISQVRALEWVAIEFSRNVDTEYLIWQQETPLLHDKVVSYIKNAKQ